MLVDNRLEDLSWWLEGALMPIYEYACEKCGAEFEVEQRITDDPLTRHEDCGGAVKRLISLSNFSLKGSGWYSDHYGLKGNGNGSSNGKSSSS
ncbi:MAG: FmdB family zinc ribbon protein [Myxococcota bacterium]